MTTSAPEKNERRRERPVDHDTTWLHALMLLLAALLGLLSGFLGAALERAAHGG